MRSHKIIIRISQQIIYFSTEERGFSVNILTIFLCDGILIQIIYFLYGLWVSGNPDNFTVSISFEYELERLVAVYMKQDYAKRCLDP
jgi:hypothetical protein